MLNYEINMYNHVVYEGHEYDPLQDLKFIGCYLGTGQRPYIRHTTKVAIYKQMKHEHPDIYERLTYRSWFSNYEDELRDGEDKVVPEPVIETKVIDNNEDEKMEDLKQNINNNMEQFAGAINNLANKLDNMAHDTKVELASKELEVKIKSDIDKYIVDTYGALPTKLDITCNDIEYEKTGIFHKDFGKVLKLVNMNLPVMLTGGAGAGKNYMLEQVANALGLDFYYTSSITQEYKLTGFIDGGGAYHETEFYKAFTKGGVFMLDEIDASIPECLVILNGAIANGYFDFPNGRQKAHKDFRCVCAGNTCGLGADMVYTGRNVIDGATLDRFVLVDIDYDPNIESNLCKDNDLRDFIYDIRKSVNTNHINHIVGMRCLKYAYQLLVNGFDKAFIVKSVILKGLQVDDINILKSSLNKESEWYQYVK